MSDVFPFDFVNLPARGRFLRLTRLDQHVPTLLDASAAVRQTLGEMMTMAAMLAFDAKHAADVTIQLQHADMGVLMFAQCNTKGGVRAYANPAARAVSFGDIVRTEGGLLAVTFVLEDGNPYQSLIPLDAPTLAGCLAQYFDTSVQTPTHLKVMVDDCAEGLGAAAMMIQRLPASEMPEDDWNRLGLLMDTLTAAEMLPGGKTADVLLGQVFAEDDVRLFEPEMLRFELEDVRPRMLAALASLPREEVEELLGEGDVTLVDEVSGRTETFSRADLLHLLTEGEA